LVVEERWNFAEPTEKLEEITLTEGNEKRRTRIGTTMPAEIRGSIVQFLRENVDVFAWSHEDIVDTDRKFYYKFFYLFLFIFLDTDPHLASVCV
jgi:hypothetical protein